MSARVIRLRYPATCAACRQALPAGTRAWWDAEARSTTCQSCAADATPGSPDRQALAKLRPRPALRSNWRQDRPAGQLGASSRNGTSAGRNGSSSAGGAWPASSSSSLTTPNRRWPGPRGPRASNVLLLISYGQPGTVPSSSMTARSPGPGGTSTTLPSRLPVSGLSMPSITRGWSSYATRAGGPRPTTGSMWGAGPDRDRRRPGLASLCRPLGSERYGRPHQRRPVFHRSGVEVLRQTFPAQRCLGDLGDEARRDDRRGQGHCP